MKIGFSAERSILSFKAVYIMRMKKPDRDGEYADVRTCDDEDRNKRSDGMHKALLSVRK
jgi:asparagine synthetase A